MLVRNIIITIRRNYLKPTKIDYKIIRFIKKKEPVHIDLILSKFKTPDLQFRIKQLRGYHYIKSEVKAINSVNETVCKLTDVYSVTQKGLSYLAEYKNKRTNFLIKNVFAPLIVTVVGALILKLLYNLLTLI